MGKSQQLDPTQLDNTQKKKKKVFRGKHTKWLGIILYIQTAACVAHTTLYIVLSISGLHNKHNFHTRFIFGARTHTNWAEKKTFAESRERLNRKKREQMLELDLAARVAR